jgi:SRSO17 transposase
MTAEELDEWGADFFAFCARFNDVFGRKESRTQARKYLRGLLSSIARKNGWQLAEAMGDKVPDPTQRLLYRTLWAADWARNLLQKYIIEVFADEDGIGVADETGFIKKGKRSVGVKRQYSGTAGKIENCQMGTFLSYATSKGHVFLDRRLYLPEDWCNDPERRVQAKVPEEVVFQTKPEQALSMLQDAWQRGVPMRWVAGDEVYGESSQLRDGIAASGRWYVLSVRTVMPVWRERPAMVEPEAQEQGRPRTKVRLADDAVPATTVKEMVANWPASRWQRLAVIEGEKGRITYDWACQRVVESRAKLPGPDAWLLARRSVSDPSEIAYYLSNAPADLPLAKLAQVASTRYTVEQCIEEAKGETGLDDYEVRYWHSWHRHITLSMMAHAWLASVRHKATEKKGGPNPSWPS